MNVIEQDWLAVTRRFRQPYVSRNPGSIDLLSEMTTNLGFDLSCKVVALIDHRKNDALDFESGIEFRAHELHRFHEIGEAFERIVFALKRDQHRIRRRQRIQREKTQRRRTVDQDDLIGVPDLLDRLCESTFSRLERNEFDFCTDEIATCRNDVKGFELRLESTLGQRHFINERIVDLSIGVADSVCAACVGLWINVDQ